MLIQEFTKYQARVAGQPQPRDEHERGRLDGDSTREKFDPFRFQKGRWNKGEVQQSQTIRREYGDDGNQQKEPHTGNQRGEQNREGTEKCRPLKGQKDRLNKGENACRQEWRNGCTEGPQRETLE